MELEHRSAETDDDYRICLVTGHRHRGAGGICAEHLAEMPTLVDGIVRMTREVGYHLIPGSAPAGEKVSTFRSGSPTPARLAALSLVGPGVSEVITDRRSIATQVRRWSEVKEYDVTFTRAGRLITERRELRVYHVEVVTDHAGRPVRYLANDQVGAVPPGEFFDAWVRKFRLVLQHGARALPKGTWVDYGEAQQDKRLARAALGETVRLNRGQLTTMHAVAEFLMVRKEYAAAAYATTAAAARAAVTAGVLGLRTDGPDHVARAEDALAGRRPPTVTHDPATAEWILRYGIAKTAASVEVDASYIKTWLPLVASMNDEQDPLELGRFATELRALYRELESTIGMSRDEQWIGRCPARLVDPRTGEDTDRLCGAGIWHDAHRGDTTPIVCPRCQTRWPVTEWLTLAAKIRYAWPIDVRRRYTAGDRRVAEGNIDRLPKCRGCERTMSVRWVTDHRRGDKQPMWRPTGYACPNRCLAGGTAEETAA